MAKPIFYRNLHKRLWDGLAVMPVAAYATAMDAITAILGDDATTYFENLPCNICVDAETKTCCGCPIDWTSGNKPLYPRCPCISANSPLSEYNRLAQYDSISRSDANRKAKKVAELSHRIANLPLSPAAKNYVVVE